MGGLSHYSVIGQLRHPRHAAGFLAKELLVYLLCLTLAFPPQILAAFATSAEQPPPPTLISSVDAEDPMGPLHAPVSVSLGEAGELSGRPHVTAPVPMVPGAGVLTGIKQPRKANNTARSVYLDLLGSAVEFAGEFLLPTAQAATLPEAGSYTVTQIPGNFVDISASGTRIEPALPNEGAAPGIPIGFDFEFFGDLYNAVTVTANGYLSFSGHVSYLNTPLPSAQTPNGLIAPFWDDLNPEYNNAGAIYYATRGTAPNRQFIVQWTEIPLADAPASRLTFQAVLFEGSQEIQFQYAAMVDGFGGTGGGMVSGATASIGLESADGSRGAEFSFNSEGAVSTGSALSWTLAGTAFETGRLLGDLDGENRITVLDQSILTELIAAPETPRAAADLVLADVAPLPGFDGRSFGDGLLDGLDHAQLFEVVMGRSSLNPTLSESSLATASAGESLTLFGAGFDPVAANNSAGFIDVEGVEVAVAPDLVTGDGTALVVTVPTGLQFISSITVNRAGLPSNAIAFVLEGAPIIASLAPASGEEGDTVLIRGYEFGPTPADNLVSFNGIAVTVDSVGVSGVLDALSVTVPAGVATGLVNVTVTGQASNDVLFTLDGPPLVAFDTPDEDAEVTSPTQIIGTAYDPNLLRYTLEYAAGDGGYTTLAYGTGSVTNEALGTLDPSLLMNGLYRLRLTAEDVGGNVSVATRDILISGNLKAGINRISFTDLQIPVSGIPITVRRTYDSRRKYRDDFGIGWSVDVLDMEVRENVTPGQNWRAVNTGGLGLPNWELVASRTHLVIVTFPDGRLELFEMKAYFDDPVNRTGNTGYVTFEAKPGTTSTLVPLGGTETVLYTGADLVDWITGELFDPDRYVLTTRDGTRLVISESTGLESLEDRNGNTLTINDNGIVHSSGKSISFRRDTLGRITQITDPSGNRLRYTYDANGDLIGFIDQENQTTRYTYDTQHNLLDYTDPRGVTSFQAEYDEDGRLVATRDADGNRIELTHDIDNYTSHIQDRLGHVTTYQYDARGNILEETDPLGHTTTSTYDEHDNRLSRTDPLGNVTTWTYDSRNNQRSETDPLGNTTQTYYDDRSLLSTVTDALGNKTEYKHDAAGNVYREIAADGCVKDFAYNTRGDLISSTDCNGATTQYEYDAFGNQTREVDALGNETTYTYDASGNQLTETRTRTTDSGPVTMTMSNTYDRLGRPVKSRGPDGYETVTEYNAIGKVSAEIDRNNHRTSYEYDDRENRTRTTYPDGTTETRTYDANGNTATLTDRAGITTRFEYDAGSFDDRHLNRPVRIVHEDGSCQEFEYDALGRNAARVDENGNRSRFEYDGTGNQTRLIDALGNVTAYAYNANGNRISTTDANGNTTTYEYDVLNRRVRTVYPDQTSTSVAYLAGSCKACAGKKTSETDQAGNTTRFEYDALGRLTRVIDSLGGETSYTYDEVGNRLMQIDANGHTTRWAYDNAARVVGYTLPMGQTESLAYDGNGNRVSRTDFNVNTLTYSFDSLNRLITRQYPDGSKVSLTYTANGDRESETDGRGTTSYSYDSRGRLVSVTHPDGAVIAYTYDPVGNRTSVTVPSGATNYAYDSLNRLAAVTEPDSGITSYVYDKVGNRTSLTYPNGTVTIYIFDVLNRLIGLRNSRSDHTLISSYAYTLGPAGNWLVVEEDAGRTVNYAYDAMYRLVEEDITDSISGGEHISYAYDPVGNRLSKTDSSNKILYTYDANDRLLAEGNTSYAYDNNGNTTSKTGVVGSTHYVYDYENRLIGAHTSSNVSEYDYDVDGIRTRVVTESTITDYLVDKNREYAQVLEERNGRGELNVRYVHGGSLISQRRTDALSYYHHDGQGSSRQLSDYAESVTDSYAYDAFGRLINRSGSTVNDYLYTGQQYDSSLKYYYLRARYYNQGAGRFLTQDPFVGSSFEPVSLHRYLYANANPIRFMDPCGQFTLMNTMTAISVRSVLAVVAISTTFGAASSYTYACLADVLNDSLDQNRRFVGEYCAATGDERVPNPYQDAFGHCWIACEGSRRCGGTTIVGVLGELRELLREGERLIHDATGWWREHDSYWQDRHNQAVGRDLSSGARSCFDACAFAIGSEGRLDLSQPTVWCMRCSDQELERCEGL